jgi:transketolase
MRREFSAWLEAYAGEHPKVVVLTGDLGFQALEGVRARIGERFVNLGVSEQNMVSVAAALASEGLAPLCYSIAPFAVFRPAEQIRLDVCVHGLSVKIIGNGGGYGYGIMGSTHHALEDLAVLSSFAGLNCFIPVTGADVASACAAMMATPGPGYLRLNLGQLPAGFTLEEPFAALRQVRPEARAPGSAPARLTVIGLGPAVLPALSAAPAETDCFVVSRMPLGELSPAVMASLRRTGRLLVLEEHVERGGLAEHLALALLRAGLAPRIWTRCALGYPSKRYGSQQFHQRECGLDAESLRSLIPSLTQESVP